MSQEIDERLDPKSPNYDHEFAELRRKAFGAWGDHQADMKSDPKYRAYCERKFK